MRSIFDLTRVQFLGSAILIWVVLAILFTLIYYFSSFFSDAKDGLWDTYELIIFILSLPYVITIILVNIFCVFQGEKGYESS